MTTVATSELDFAACGSLMDPVRLQELVTWLQAYDESAAHHLVLLGRSLTELRRLLAGGAPSEAALVDRLERWRCQLFRARPAELPGQVLELADAVDLIGNRLAGRPTRPPRSTWAAIDASRWEVLSALQPWRAALEPLQLASSRTTAQMQLIARAATLTARNFGNLPAEQLRSGFSAGGDPHPRSMFLYAPLYLSSHCVNSCSYCGFRYSEDIVRRHLDCAEAVAEARVLSERGFRHVLLVASDFPKLTSPAYFAEIIRAIRNLGMSVAVEIASQPTSAYAELAQAGACGVILYQETYDPWLYNTYHVSGPKASYPWRLESHDRIADAGINWLGLGVLLGLSDPWLDLASLICHGRYLAARYPQARLSFSLPRLHDVPAGFTPPYVIDDELFVALYCLLRVEFPTAELVLSTREPAPLRNRLAKICITHMSAGSSTSPGGYQCEDCTPAVGEQFAISDQRSPAEVSGWLVHHGFEVRWERG